MTPSWIEYQNHDGIVCLRLNRPESRNAIDDAMRAQLLSEVDRAGADRAVRAVIVTGNGPAFCAGGDIRAMRARMQAPLEEVGFNGWSRQQQTHKLLTTLYALPKPVIAAVNGPCTGLGADLAMACDFVIASSASTFAWNYVLRGLIPDGGGMYFLPRRVGMAKAKELIFSGRTLDADEARSLGIADRLAAPDALVADALAWARELTGGSAPALALAKSILNQSYESSAEQVFQMGSQAQGLCYVTREHRDAVAAFLNRKPGGGRA